MQCKEVNVLLSAYMDSELSPIEKVQVESHILVCPSCQTMLSDLESMGSSLKQTHASVFAPDDMLTEVMGQLVSTKQNAQVGRVATVYGVILGITCFMGLVLVLSPAGIMFWPILHLILSVVRGIYGLRNSIGFVWTLSGLFVAFGFSFIWLRLMGRILRHSRSEATI